MFCVATKIIKTEKFERPNSGFLVRVYTGTTRDLLCGSIIFRLSHLVFPVCPKTVWWLLSLQGEEEERCGVVGRMSKALVFYSLYPDAVVCVSWTLF
jgi:hypothetical protein